MDISNFKSGQLENRHRCKAFLPERICREWAITDPELTELLGRADRALGELNGYVQLIPDIEFIIHMFVAKEATQSSRIEGMQTDIEDAFKDADSLDPKKRDDRAEVQNCIKAINYAINELSKSSLSNRLLRRTHGILMSGERGEHKRPGQFRRSQNWVGVSLRNAVFVPAHHDHVPDLMSDLEAFLHADDLYVHPLVRIAIAHYQFETIHPFLDSSSDALFRKTSTVHVKLTGDGTYIGPRQHIVTFGFTLLDEGSAAKSFAGNHTVCIVRGPEDYDSLSICFHNNGLEVDRNRYTVQFYLGADWKFLAIWHVVLIQ